MVIPTIVAEILTHCITCLIYLNNNELHFLYLNHVVTMVPVMQPLEDHMAAVNVSSILHTLELYCPQPCHR